MYKLQDYSIKVKILNYLVFLFPLGFILGNLAINSLIFLIGIIGLINYKKEIESTQSVMRLKQWE